MVTTDDYERRFMGDGEVVYRERIRMAWWGHALHILGFILAIHAFMVSGAWLGLVVVPLAWLVLMTLRVAVSRTDVHVQLGLFGPRVPLADIETVEAVKGGLLGLRARMAFEPTFSVPSHARDMVRITYRDGARRRKVRFASHDAPRMVRAIESARTAGWARIALVTPPPAAEVAARELAEAQAELEEELSTRVEPWARRGTP
jgi:hypothetical protein